MITVNCEQVKIINNNIDSFPNLSIQITSLTSDHTTIILFLQNVSLFTLTNCHSGANTPNKDLIVFKVATGAIDIMPNRVLEACVGFLLE